MEEPSNGIRWQHNAVIEQRYNDRKESSERLDVLRRLNDKLKKQNGRSGRRTRIVNKGPATSPMRTNSKRNSRRSSTVSTVRKSAVLQNGSREYSQRFRDDASRATLEKHPEPAPFQYNYNENDRESVSEYDSDMTNLEMREGTHLCEPLEDDSQSTAQHNVIVKEAITNLHHTSSGGLALARDTYKNARDDWIDSDLEERTSWSSLSDEDSYRLGKSSQAHRKHRRKRSKRRHHDNEVDSSKLAAAMHELEQTKREAEERERENELQMSLFKGQLLSRTKEMQEQREMFIKELFLLREELFRTRSDKYYDPVDFQLFDWEDDSISHFREAVQELKKNQIHRRKRMASQRRARMEISSPAKRDDEAVDEQETNASDQEKIVDNAPEIIEDELLDKEQEAKTREIEESEMRKLFVQAQVAKAKHVASEKSKTSQELRKLHAQIVEQKKLVQDLQKRLHQKTREVSTHQDELKQLRRRPQLSRRFGSSVRDLLHQQKSANDMTALMLDEKRHIEEMNTKESDMQETLSNLKRLESAKGREIAALSNVKREVEDLRMALQSAKNNRNIDEQEGLTDMILGTMKTQVPDEDAKLTIATQTSAYLDTSNINQQQADVSKEENEHVEQITERPQQQQPHLPRQDVTDDNPEQKTGNQDKVGTIEDMNQETESIEQQQQQNDSQEDPVQDTTCTSTTDTGIELSPHDEAAPLDTEPKTMPRSTPKSYPEDSDMDNQTTNPKLMKFPSVVNVYAAHSPSPEEHIRKGNVDSHLQKIRAALKDQESKSEVVDMAEKMQISQIEAEIEGFHDKYRDLFSDMARVRKRMKFYDENKSDQDEHEIAPDGFVTLVFTDVQDSTRLWELNPEAMAKALRIHNEIIRSILKETGGFEVKTEGDAFMCSFSNCRKAVNFALRVQIELLSADWPEEILKLDPGRIEYDEKDTSNVVFRGLRVRMGIHAGKPIVERDPVTGRADYFGPVVNRAARVEGQAKGGQIAISSSIWAEINDDNATVDQMGADEAKLTDEENFCDAIWTRLIGVVALKGMDVPETVRLILPHRLKNRKWPLPPESSKSDSDTTEPIGQEEDEDNQSSLQQLKSKLFFLEEKHGQLERERDSIQDRIKSQLNLKTIENAMLEKDNVISYLKRKLAEVRSSYEKSIFIKDEEQQRKTEEKTSRLKDEIEAVMRKYEEMREQYMTLHHNYENVVKVFDLRLADELNNFKDEIGQMGKDLADKDDEFYKEKVEWKHEREKMQKKMKKMNKELSEKDHMLLRIKNEMMERFRKTPSEIDSMFRELSSASSASYFLDSTCTTNLVDDTISTRVNYCGSPVRVIDVDVREEVSGVRQGFGMERQSSNMQDKMQDLSKWNFLRAGLAKVKAGKSHSPKQRNDFSSSSFFQLPQQRSYSRMLEQYDMEPKSPPKLIHRSSEKHIPALTRLTNHLASSNSLERLANTKNNSSGSTIYTTHGHQSPLCPGSAASEAVSRAATAIHPPTAIHPSSFAHPKPDLESVEQVPEHSLKEENDTLNEKSDRIKKVQQKKVRRWLSMVSSSSSTNGLLKNNNAIIQEKSGTKGEIANAIEGGKHQDSPQKEMVPLPSDIPTNIHATNGVSFSPDTHPRQMPPQGEQQKRQPLQQLKESRSQGNRVIPSSSETKRSQPQKRIVTVSVPKTLQRNASWDDMSTTANRGLLKQPVRTKTMQFDMESLPKFKQSHDPKVPSNSYVAKALQSPEEDDSHNVSTPEQTVPNTIVHFSKVESPPLALPYLSQQRKVATSKDASYDMMNDTRDDDEGQLFRKYTLQKTKRYRKTEDLANLGQYPHLLDDHMGVFCIVDDMVDPLTGFGGQYDPESLTDLGRIRRLIGIKNPELRWRSHSSMEHSHPKEKDYKGVRSASAMDTMGDS